MDGTQYRIINQMQVIQNFCHIRKKTLNFLLQPYDESLLDEFTIDLQQLGVTIESLFSHFDRPMPLKQAERQLRQRSVGVFQRKLATQLDIVRDSIELLEVDFSNLPLEPWERGIANQMLSHLQNLVITQERLLEDLTRNHWEITNILGDTQ